jgi:hypothetical protein
MCLGRVFLRVTVAVGVMAAVMAALVLLETLVFRELALEAGAQVP